MDTAELTDLLKLQGENMSDEQLSLALGMLLGEGARLPDKMDAQYFGGDILGFSLT